MFDKRESLFPIKSERTDLNHCGIAPMYLEAAKAMQAFSDGRVRGGAPATNGYFGILDSVHGAAAKVMETSPENIAFMKNTAEGLSAIAMGYPFEDGDEIISYVNEYPSNHYPWLLQERRGVTLKLLPDSGSEEGQPRGWHMEDLEALVTERTRMVAVSHVQFTSGFAADLGILGQFCHERGIELVVDAAQSLGCLPVYPERWHISAVACSGWKWLMGPIGCGLLYTSPELRAKLEIVMVGADIVTQGCDYLDHRWQPFTDARMFEYSTVQITAAAGLARCLADFAGTYGSENIRDEVFRLQDVFLDSLDDDRFRPLHWPDANRSGILALVCERPEELSSQAIKAGLTVTSRGGYLRVAPHFYNDDEQVVEAAKLLGSL